MIMKRLFIFILCVPQGAVAADPDAGTALFRSCTACHAVTAPDGRKVMRGGAMGPDLYGIVGRQAGGVSGYRYSDGLLALGGAGHVWDEASLAAFITSPNGFLEERLGPGHRSKMPFGLTKGADDIAAWLAGQR